MSESIKIVFPLPRPVVVLALVLLAAAPASGAEELPGHAHEPLPVDNSMTLSGTVDAALASFPDTIALAARQNEARAWAERWSSVSSHG